MNPDQGAAHSGTWKGHPLPLLGRKIKARSFSQAGYGRRITRTVAGEVTWRGIKPSGELEIHVNNVPVILGPDTLTDRWEYIDGQITPVDVDSLPEVERRERYLTHREDSTEWGDLELSDLEDRLTVTTVAGETVPDPAATTTMGKIRRLVWLKKHAKSLGARLDGIKDEIRELDEDIRADWAEEGLSNVSVDGTTVYLYPVFHVEHLPGVKPDDVRDALVASGLEHMVKPTYAANTLKAYLKELRQQGQQPPEALAAVTKLVISSEIRVKNAAGRTVPIVY